MLTKAMAKPVVKWAGGKNQLLEQISLHLPDTLRAGGIQRYVEPFLGGGAVFFHVAQNYPVREYYLFDANHEIVVLYRSIQENVETLIRQLEAIQAVYHALSRAKQEEYFYKVRSEYNGLREQFDFDHFSVGWMERAAQIIFLNRTCFNGLFRVNSEGAFNVPFGDYKNPRICDDENLRLVSKVLNGALIQAADFSGCEPFVNRRTFVYFDPPYRPISKTASFKSYSRNSFGDAEQVRLAEFFAKLDAKGARLMLSNSDPKNENPGDEFFDRLYARYHIHRVSAARNINSNGAKRGPIFELLITNY